MGNHNASATSGSRAVLALNMKLLRASQGRSQEDLALECELHRTFIGHVERGARNVSLDNIDKIARALGVKTFELLIPPEQAAPDSKP